MILPMLTAEQGAPGGGFGSMLIPFLMIIVLFYFLMIRPQRNKEKAHKTLLNALKKNDRVVTIGGIYGVVTQVQREVDEVILKVDEATNAKIRVTFGSIARVITEEKDGGKVDDR